MKNEKENIYEQIDGGCEGKKFRARYFTVFMRICIPCFGFTRQEKHEFNFKHIKVIDKPSIS